ncbi:MAG: hypothetical protein NT085_04825 [candidate division SR1 bacterium]|nr:hypothetical protein [candidate division SR1 bacterium]
MVGGETLKNNENTENKMDAAKQAVNIITTAKDPEKVNTAVENNKNINQAKLAINNLVKNNKDNLPNINPNALVIEKNQIAKKENIKTIPTKETFEITKPLLNIRDLKSGDSKISEENAPTIINAINNLGEFQTLKIVGCTDADKIETPNAIEKNTTQFETIKSQYIAAGGICPTYAELLKSPNDPQNTILGFTRAMEGILSLKLTPEQMKKVEIGNKLGTTTNNGKERGFDIETNYTKMINGITYEKTHQAIYKIFGELSQKNIGRYRDNTGTYTYAIDNLELSTSGEFTKIYEDIFSGVKQIVGDRPELENKVKEQTAIYLNHLINVCGGKYNNGTWGSNAISDKMYFMIKAVDQNTGFLSQEEFTTLTEKGDLSILEGKKISTGQSVKDYITDKKIVSIYKVGNDALFYTTTDPNQENRSERKISKNDYNLLGLYFQMKNSN